MKILSITLIILLLLIIIFIVLGILVYKHKLKKDKYDLLNYLKSHKDMLSITIKEDGINTAELNSDKRFPLASTLKLVIAFNFVRMVEDGQLSISEREIVNYIDKFYIKNTDGGAHPNWKSSIGNPRDVSMLDIAKGMMQFSSNACTDYLISKIGLDNINKSLETLQMNNHDKITYLTPLVLMPGYLSDKKKIAAGKLSTMTSQSYQKLSEELFNKMATDQCSELKKRATQMLNKKTQYFITKKFPSSTTAEYANLMFKLGTKLLSVEEKELFDEILIGKNIKDRQEDSLWYKGGSTMFVLTSALYRGNKDHSISISLFFRDDKAEQLYWIQHVFNDFIFSIATDTDFRKQVKKVASTG